MAAPSTSPDPVAWPVALFEVERGIGLAVCVAHRGAHAWYQGGCVAFAAGRLPRWAGRAKSCPEPGCHEAPYIPHRHPADNRVEVTFDEERLAAAIVAASSAVRERRRDDRQQQHRHAAVAGDRPPRQAPEPTPAAPASAGGPSIPTVTVWSPGPGDGAGG